MKSLLILGAGGHGTVVKEVAEECGYDQIGFLDDFFQDVLGKISELDKFTHYENIFISIGDNKLRSKFMNKAISLDFNIPTLVHPTAYVSKSAQIGKGTIIEPKAVVNSNVKIGEGCIISVGAIVDHNVTIEDYVHINAGTIVKSGSVVEKYEKLTVKEKINA